MTEREKIIDILNKNFTQEVECTPVYTTADGKEIELPQELCDIFNDIVTQAVIPYFADALIAAGIGDTTNLIVENEVLQRDVENLSRTLEEGTEEFQEVQHRAEVAERALKNAIKYYGFEFCPDPDCIPINECGSEGCIEHLQEGWIKQAEGELAEEKKE